MNKDETSAVADLQAATNDFESSRIECDGVLATVPQLDVRDRHSLATLGADIVDSCRHAIPEAVVATIQAVEKGWGWPSTSVVLLRWSEASLS